MCIRDRCYCQPFFINTSSVYNFFAKSSSMSAWDSLLTSRPKIFSADAIARSATCSLSSSLALFVSCSISFLASDSWCSLSFKPSCLPSETISVALAFAWSKIFVACLRASSRIFFDSMLALSSFFLPCSPAAIPSAICVCRSSIAVSYTHLTLPTKRIV